MGSIPAGPLLLVSPHLDDAILSCEALVAREEPLDVLTVFAGSPDPPQRGWWDLECGFADSSEGMAARRAEDEAAFAGTPHHREYLSLLEIQHDPRRADSDRERIAAAVSTWTSDRPSGTVALPAGAGCPQNFTARWLRALRRQKCSPPQHADHVYVRDAALAVLRGSGATPLLYEEVPYVFGGSADREVDQVARAGGWHAEPVTIEIDRERKARRVAAYASQIPHISPGEGRLDEPNILPPVERYWALRRISS